MDNELATALSQLARALVYLGDIYARDVERRHGILRVANRPRFADEYDWQVQRDDEEKTEAAYQEALKQHGLSNEEDA